MDKLMIPCCYHPTTIMLIDDDYKYLHGLHLELKNTAAAYKLLNNPNQVLHFLNEEYEYPYERMELEYE